MPFPRVVGYVEPPWECRLFEILDTRIFDGTQVAVFENTEKRFVIDSYKQVLAS